MGIAGAGEAMLILSVTIAFLLLGVLWLVAVLHEHGLKPMRRMAELMKRPAAEVALVALVAIGMIHHGATKGTNGVNGAGGEMGGTNGVQNMGGVLTGLMGLTGFGDGGSALPNLDLQPSTLNPLPPTTNSDWLAFGGYDDWFYLDGGGWCFRFGSNLVERLTVFSCGEISPAPYDASNRISLLGLPLSIVPAANWHLLGNGEQGTGNGSPQPSTLNPQQSLFCHEETPSNTLLLTWQNALVNRDTNLPVTVQAELFPDGTAALRYGFDGIGDINSLSNAEARIVRDGVPEAVPLMTGTVTLVEFAAPAIAGTNALDEVYARIADGNTNAYYCADVVVSKGPAKIRVEPMEDETNRGLLGAYEIVAMPGETNRLPLLIGPKYTVSAETAFGAFELVPPPFVPLADDTGTVERLSFGDALTLTNITDRLVEIQWPVVYWLKAIDATPEAATYELRVSPDWLDGILSWHDIADTNAPPMRGAPPMRSGGDSCSCGCLARDIDHLIHSLTCGCEHCYAEGEYGYEGHSKVVSFDMKDIGNGGGGTTGDEGGDENPPLESPWVSVAFDKDVLIFEDEYENSPGVTVPRRSKRVKLTLTAHGGDFGCAFTYQAPNEEKMLRVDGGSPPPSYVSADSDIEWTAYYEGIKASTQMDDLRAMVTYTDPVTGQTIQSCTDVTVVEVKIKAQDTAPQNNCWQRHNYGVCERVVLQHAPMAAQVEWTAPAGFTIGTATNSQYKLLVCPVLGGAKNITAALGDVDLSIPLNIVEPQFIFVTNVEAIVTNYPVGTAGHVGMKMDQYVGPLTVAFYHIAIEETPNSGGFHSGYFDDPGKSNLWVHSYAMGAGKWVKVHGNHFIVRDRASCGACPPPWSYGSLIWDVPFAWHSLTEAGDAPPMGTSPEGEFATETKSTTVITASGMVFVMKLGHWVSRDIYNEIALDGVVVREGDQ